MQETIDRFSGERDFELFEGDNLVEKMNDGLMKKSGNPKLVKRTFYKNVKAARKEQKKARRKNRK